MHSDKEQLKQKLLAYDPARDENPDAAIAEGLAEVASNPELKVWFDAERSFDRQFSKSLSNIPVPQNLKAQILEAVDAQKITPISTDTFTNKPETFKSWWLNAGLIGGMVAAVLIATVYFTFFVNPFAPRATPELQQFVERIEHIADDLPRDMHVAKGYQNLASFLSSRGAPVPSGLTEAFKKEAGYACNVIKVDGKVVGVMCFKINADRYHVFSIDRSEMPNIQNIPRPIISQIGKHACATWTDDKNIYVLATTAPKDTLLTVL